jgi:hypothetical protein
MFLFHAYNSERNGIGTEEHRKRNCENFQKKFSSYARLGYIANNLINNEGGWQEMLITIEQ